MSFAFFVSSLVSGIHSFSYLPLNIAMSFSHLIEGNTAFARHEVDELPSAMAVYISSSNPLDVYRKTKIFKCVLQYSLEYLLVKSLVHSTYIYNFKSSYLIEFTLKRYNIIFIIRFREIHYLLSTKLHVT